MAPWRTLVLSFVFSLHSVDSLLLPDRRCIPTTVVRGPCHACVCTSNGLFQCNVLPCNFGNLNLRVMKKECEPNFMYRHDNIFCTCDSAGYWKSLNCQTTFKNLLRISSSKTEIQSGTRTSISCEPHNLYLVGCNICECSKKGFLHPDLCTNRACPRNNKISKCRFGDYLRLKHELCVCSDINYYIDRLCIPIGNRIIQKIDYTLINKVIQVDKSSKRSFNSSSERCVPGSTYWKDCNKCFCSEGGLACTAKVCFMRNSPEVLRLNGALDNEHEQIEEHRESEVSGRKKSNTSIGIPTIKDGEPCIPGQMYKLDCNTCRCGVNNTLYCTKMACINRTMLNFKKLNSNVELPELLEKCTPGVIYSKGCSRCFCNDNGEAECKEVPCEDIKTKKVETPADVTDYKPESVRSLTVLPSSAEKCVPGRKYRVDCNVCLCLKNMNLFCSKMLCISPEDMNRIQAMKYTGKICKKDELPRQRCIRCSCLKGKSSCEPVADCVPSIISRRSRNSSVPYLKSRLPYEGSKCVPSTVYKIDCNKCYCQTDGTMRCTNKVCLNFVQLNTLRKQRERLLKHGL